MKQRLDQLVYERGMAGSRSQAAAIIMAGRVSVDGKKADKAGHFVKDSAVIEIKPAAQYASRAGMKLASVAGKLGLDFQGKTVLDVGASTGGFTDFALQHGAKKVYAVDVGTQQLDWRLRNDDRVVVMEKTDIRDLDKLPDPLDVVVIDVSFISLRLVLPAAARLASDKTLIVPMVKPQFETDRKTASMHKGVIKNDTIRRQILKDVELWFSRNGFVVKAKADSEVKGAKGNVERFYLLRYAQK